MMMRPYWIGVLLTLLSLQTARADGWDEQTYREIERSIRQPQFPDRTLDICTFGARQAASAADNQKAIQQAIDRCERKGGGRVVVPAGQHFLTGAIQLKSHVCLVVEEGATLEFAFEPDLYPIVPTRWEGLDCWNLSPCIYAYKATDVGITGRGTIDGGGTRQTWWPWCGAAKYGWREGMTTQKTAGRPRLLQAAEDGVPMDERRFTKADGLRPQLIGLNQCDGILIEDVTLLRSPFWVIHPLLSTDVTVRGVHINNDGPNGDGCDPESCNRVLIENCYFNTGDDCIAIKSGRNNDGRLWQRPSENIIIRHCQMKNGHGGVVIGSEISGGCRRVFAHDCVMDSPQLERVVRIKTNTCRGGLIEDIHVKRVEVGVCKESVLKINLDYEPGELCCRGYLPTVRRVSLDSVNCQRSQYGVQVIALDTVCNVSDIAITNCRFNGVEQGNSIRGLTRDIRYRQFYVNGSMVLNQSPYSHYSEWMTRSEMRRQPRSYLLDFSRKPKWSYVMGIELEAMLDTYLRYGGQDIMDYCTMYTDTMIGPQGDIRSYRLEDYNLDQVRTGHFVARMYQQQPQPRLLQAVKTLALQLDRQPRTTQDHVFWHKAIYAHQVWLDGIFMGLPFRALTAPMLLEPRQVTAIYDDAVNQMAVTYQRTLDPKTGLNRHAWDATGQMFWADSITGLSQHCWGRAQGWYTMALVELLDVLPADYGRRQEVIDLLRRDLDGILRWQDSKTGLWYQVMDAPQRDGNYLESTCSCMFAYALLKAYRKGYVGASYRDAGLRAYRSVVNRFIRVEPDSTISLTGCCSVAGLGPGISEQVLAAAPQVKENRRRDGSFAYYISEPVRDNDAKGIGPFIWASLEAEQLGYDVTAVSQPIDRKAVVTRHHPLLTTADTLSSLSVGNGHFAVTVDVTGLQSFPEHYQGGIPLSAMSDWGWHRFPNPDSLRHDETLATLSLGHGHEERYAVEYKQGGRQQQATRYYRENPHRLNLGTIGLGVSLADITDIRQELKLWDGIIESSYRVKGTPVQVTTACLQDRDALVCRISSQLLSEGTPVVIRFSYPTGRHSDDANDWQQPQSHQSSIVSSHAHGAVIERTLDGTRYYLVLRWHDEATLTPDGPHRFLLTSPATTLSFTAEYLPALDNPDAALATTDKTFSEHQRAVMKAWNRWWQQGAIADFSQCTDPRAHELERRVVLSQYLTRINCDGNMPPQETGLTYNSWFGRPHLEMAWWHLVDFALWGRSETVRRMLAWYDHTAAPIARNIAGRQGFQGLRWMKMTDPWAGEAPSNVGSFLIWQQPHYIYMAEELYRADPTAETLRRYAPLVEETARFMADYVTSEHGICHLRGVTAMQESMSRTFSYDHPFELAYWRYGLSVAQRWRERQQLPREKSWDDIMHRLASLPRQDSVYTAGRLTDDRPEYALKARSDHPAVLGAFGLLPQVPDMSLRPTYDWVVSHWRWDTTWGWDYGMMAMAAARMGDGRAAVDALLMPTQKNTYLPNGHNYQDQRLRLYLPGNGALLTAVAMMCAGWDGCQQPCNPGFPADGTWNVRWEGLSRMQ